jgi:hypothetical protein
MNVTCAIGSERPTNADFALSGNWYEPLMSGLNHLSKSRRNKPLAEKDPSAKEPNEPKQIGAQCEQERQLDEFERFLVLLFLRRYVTYLARRTRFAQMNGAAALHCHITGSQL